MGISAPEMKRRLLHLAPGFVPLAFFPAFPRGTVPSPRQVRLLSLGAGLSLVAVAAVSAEKVLRPNEATFTRSVVGYAVPVLGLFALRPAAPQLALTTLAAVAFGDGTATLGGTLLGGPRLPWNRAKTLSGSACFVLTATPFAWLYAWRETLPPISAKTAFLRAAAACCVAALCESIPSRRTDNLRVGLAAGLTAILLSRPARP